MKFIAPERCSKSMRIEGGRLESTLLMSWSVFSRIDDAHCVWDVLGIFGQGRRTMFIPMVCIDSWWGSLCAGWCLSSQKHCSDRRHLIGVPRDRFCWLIDAFSLFEIFIIGSKRWFSSVGMKRCAFGSILCTGRRIFSVADGVQSLESCSSSRNHGCQCPENRQR